ncbi:hypothetical protein Sango_2085000 [Sesamum angolense]|uniref:Uncharacterized protein n=1 Tax=Sesamum angolense TaxID=2727404 RepID=A0AAE1WB87_9LAMI|nr:hypothetical protein Sango_2085000 [Sesamum angolense]
MLEKPDTSGCLLKWAVELSEYEVSYLPQTTIKAEALADFIFKMAEISSGDIKFDFKASNNEAEYEALLIGMKMTYEARARPLQMAELKTSFKSFRLTQIPREDIKADCLFKLASSLEDFRTIHITIQYLLEPRAPLAIQAISSAQDWRTPVVK